ncbi:MarR family winged helix-turn-helix transcriptional regulator [Lentzea albida]|uniref:DNA-binding transcriptional regulator, MarR family n=1 Tax=Lentzea albida TaxID=65499 RepID=A0A1H9K3N9_9PSEU|nr:MarR family transcriptional regulator [Lentzea albida]SEQ93465.1 DNA-binding transcriptional regulator, MarR family [Lentzea albida]
MADAELERAVRLNHEIFMRTSDRIAGVLAEHGLTHATAQVLWALDPARPPASMKALAAQLYCNASNLTFMAGQLLDRGLVERAVDRDDRRSRVLVLTEEGVRVRAAVLSATLGTSPLAGLAPDRLAALLELMEDALADTRRTGAPSTVE